MSVDASKKLMSGDLRWLEKGVIKGNIDYPKDFQA